MSIATFLLPLAVNAGAPLVEKLLAGKIGEGGAGLVRRVVETIAEQAGTTPDRLEDLAQSDPLTVEQAIAQAEHMAPELVALYAQGLDYQMAVLESEADGPLWMRAWRPAGMYLIFALWIWNAVVLHSLNAVFKIALPPIDWSILLQFTGLYLGLYMGGHTLKDFFSKKWGGA